MKLTDIFNNNRIQRISNNGLVEVKEFWNSGQLKFHYYEKDGLKHGIYKRFRYNGKIIVSANYNKGQLHGKYQEFHEDKLVMECNYENNKLYGEYKTWYTTGQLKKKILFL